MAAAAAAVGPELVETRAGVNTHVVSGPHMVAHGSVYFHTKTAHNSIL